MIFFFKPSEASVSEVRYLHSVLEPSSSGFVVVAVDTFQCAPILGLVALLFSTFFPFCKRRA